LIPEGLVLQQAEEENQWDQLTKFHLETTTTLYPFNGLFSRTTWVSRHQKAKPFWILLQQEIMGWQWHLLDNMQIICTSLQTDNCASTSPHSFYRLDALAAAKPTALKHAEEVKVI